ncbi:hypothetical protein [Amycolatopsis sp. VC5-11]|uniref:hypothetical protein n=1 Tax=Amycolatopsis sp. VC5-11 TaxID=3120156 RepID=UPI00300ACF01
MVLRAVTDVLAASSSAGGDGPSGLSVFLVLAGIVAFVCWVADRVKESNAEQEAVSGRRTVDDAKPRNPRDPGAVQTPAVNARDVLVDSDRARHAIRDIVTEITRVVADEARAHADAVPPPATGLCQQTRLRERKVTNNRTYWAWTSLSGSRPTSEAAGSLGDISAWAGSRSWLLSEVHPEAGRVLRETMTPLIQRFPGKVSVTHGYADDGSGLAVLPLGQWETLIEETHTALAALSTSLPALPLPEMLPLLHPPDEATLKSGETRESIEESLAKFIEHATALREAALSGSWPDEFDEWTWKLDGGVLHGFETELIRRRLDRVVEGFGALNMPADGLAQESYRLLRVAYITIALNYLTEVHGRMDKYARDSKPSTGTGTNIHIGASMYGTLVIDSRVRDIKNVLTPVTERGDDRLADAIQALTNAVAQDPDLDDNRRADLFYNVEDIAEAAAQPDDDRKLSRARLALGAVTDAAKSATMLASTVTAWQDALGKFF